jgi:hypothetical protein
MFGKFWFEILIQIINFDIKNNDINWLIFDINIQTKNEV